MRQRETILPYRVPVVPSNEPSGEMSPDVCLFPNNVCMREVSRVGSMSVLAHRRVMLQNLELLSPWDLTSRGKLGGQISATLE